MRVSIDSANAPIAPAPRHSAPALPWSWKLCTIADIGVYFAPRAQAEASR